MKTCPNCGSDRIQKWIGYTCLDCHKEYNTAWQGKSTLCFDERKLLDGITVTIQTELVETPKHKLLKKIGLLIATIGFKIYGVGEVKVEEVEG